MVSVFSVRLVDINYVLVTPAAGVDICYTRLDGCAVQKVPVIRMFGTTPAGQKVCCHVHKVFPYFYVPYYRELPSDQHEAQAYLRQLAAAIDAAAGPLGKGLPAGTFEEAMAGTGAVQQQVDPQGEPTGGRARPTGRGWRGQEKRQIVYSVQLVRGKDFYGYHAEEQPFIKIMLFDPGMVTRVSSLLQEGGIMGRRWQPYEAHVPYLLQFKIDFNLYGMGLVNFRDVKFRAPVPADPDIRSSQRSQQLPSQLPRQRLQYTPAHSGQGLPSSASPGAPLADSQKVRWTSSTIPDRWLWGTADSQAVAPARVSVCEVEVDALAEDILNRLELVRTPLPEASSSQRLVESLVPMWAEEEELCKEVGCDMPQAPLSPPRTPQDLSWAVDVVRQELKAIVAQQQEAVQGHTDQSLGVGSHGRDPNAVHLNPDQSPGYEEGFWATPANNHACTVLAGEVLANQVEPLGSPQSQLLKATPPANLCTAPCIETQPLADAPSHLNISGMEHQPEWVPGPIEGPVEAVAGHNNGPAAPVLLMPLPEVHRERFPAAPAQGEAMGPGAGAPCSPGRLMQPTGSIAEGAVAIPHDHVAAAAAAGRAAALDAGAVVAGELQGQQTSPAAQQGARQHSPQPTALPDPGNLHLQRGPGAPAWPSAGPSCTLPPLRIVRTASLMAEATPGSSRPPLHPNRSEGTSQALSQGTPVTACQGTPHDAVLRQPSVLGNSFSQPLAWTPRGLAGALRESPGAGTLQPFSPFAPVPGHLAADDVVMLSQQAAELAEQGAGGPAGPWGTVEADEFDDGDLLWALAQEAATPLQAQSSQQEAVQRARSVQEYVSAAEEQECHDIMHATQSLQHHEDSPVQDSPAVQEEGHQHMRSGTRQQLFAEYEADDVDMDDISDDVHHAAPQSNGMHVGRPTGVCHVGTFETELCALYSSAAAGHPGVIPPVGQSRSVPHVEHPSQVEPVPVISYHSGQQHDDIGYGMLIDDVDAFPELQVKLPEQAEQRADSESKPPSTGKQPVQAGFIASEAAREQFRQQRDRMVASMPHGRPSWDPGGGPAEGPVGNPAQGPAEHVADGAVKGLANAGRVSANAVEDTGADAGADGWRANAKTIPQLDGSGDTPPSSPDQGALPHQVHILEQCANTQVHSAVARQATGVAVQEAVQAAVLAVPGVGGEGVPGQDCTLVRGNRLLAASERGAQLRQLLETGSTTSDSTDASKNPVGQSVDPGKRGPSQERVSGFPRASMHGTGPDPKGPPARRPSAEAVQVQQQGQHSCAAVMEDAVVPAAVHTQSGLEMPAQHDACYKTSTIILPDSEEELPSPLSTLQLQHAPPSLPAASSSPSLHIGAVQSALAHPPLIAQGSQQPLHSTHVGSQPSPGAACELPLQQQGDGAEALDLSAEYVPLLQPTQLQIDVTPQLLRTRPDSLQRQPQQQLHSEPGSDTGRLRGPACLDYSPVPTLCLDNPRSPSPPFVQSPSIPPTVPVSPISPTSGFESHEQQGSPPKAPAGAPAGTEAGSALSPDGSPLSRLNLPPTVAQSPQQQTDVQQEWVQTAHTATPGAGSRQHVVEGLDLHIKNHPGATVGAQGVSTGQPFANTMLVGSAQVPQKFGDSLVGRSPQVSLLEPAAFSIQLAQQPSRLLSPCPTTSPAAKTTELQSRLDCPSVVASTWSTGPGVPAAPWQSPGGQLSAGQPALSAAALSAKPQPCQQLHAGRVLNREAAATDGHTDTLQLVTYRFRMPAPTPEHLAESCFEHGLQPVMHPEAFYGNVEDVPSRPTVFAAQQFRVPSSAVADLKPFSLSAARPPTRDAVALQPDMTHGQRGRGADTGVAAASGSGFKVDPLSGHLIPINQEAVPNTQEGDQDLDCSLAATPAPALPATQPTRQDCGAPAGTPVETAGPPDSAVEEYRPPSPKYDERSFFISMSQLQPRLTGTPARTPQQAMKRSAGGSRGGPSTSKAAGPSRLGPLPGSADLQRSQSQQLAALPLSGPSASRLAVASQGPGPSGPADGEVQGAIAGPPAGLHKGAPALLGGKARHSALKTTDKSQITPPSRSNTRGGNGGSIGFRQEHTQGQMLTLMAIEIHAASRNTMLPDPRLDAVRCMVVGVHYDWQEGDGSPQHVHVLLLSTAAKPVNISAAAATTGHQAHTGTQVNAADAKAPAEQLPEQLPEQVVLRLPQQVQAERLDCSTRAELQAQAAGTEGHVLQCTAAGADTLAGKCTTEDVAAGIVAVDELGCRSGQSLAAASSRPIAQVHDPMHVLAGQAQKNAQLSGFGNQDTADAPAKDEVLAAVQLRLGIDDLQFQVLADEVQLLEAFVALTSSYDPDILLGWEVQKAGLGYVLDRAAALEFPLLKKLSRTPEEPSPKEGQEDEWGRLHASGVHISGRVVLNLWRLLRTDVKLNIYTFENCCAHILQRRVPLVSQRQMEEWFMQGPAGGQWRCVSHVAERVRLSLQLLHQMDFVGRTAELARTFGIDFFSVLSRGSQYRVESMLLRLAHTQNYVAISPSREQVARQPAMECIPLVMEPRSRLYVAPLVVLDFQSLYPSMIIAYNLCYSTCLGRVAHIAAAGEGVKLGVTSLEVPAGSLSGELNPDKLIITPNGVVFAPPSARPGVVPRMLREILSTRVMVKGAMKRVAASGTPGAPVRLRCLNARQLALKLIANVTYGYAGAGFSGRMPSAELADAIVQSGRQTLENAIKMVEENREWRASVVYGDTDSLFVLLPGRSRAEAFRIGQEIAAKVTAANPPPVTLKMEKVYHPCVLLSKKRYVGAMYESPAQAEPTFDAKGIETVRRDTCSAVAKMLERCLKIIFRTRDVSQVKRYVVRQFDKILSGRVSVQDFVFAKEVRLGTYSDKGTLPPAALVATQMMAVDPRAEPLYGQRIPYVVVYGDPGARLVDLVVPPEALVEGRGRLRLHAVYYITKQIIPALDRVFSLMGVDVKSWFATMPRPQRLLPQKRPINALPLGAPHGKGGAMKGPLGGATIDSFYQSRHCTVCDGLTNVSQPVCDQCQRNPQLAVAVLEARAARLQGQYALAVRMCLHCGGGGGQVPANMQTPMGDIVCQSLDCGLYYERWKLAGEAAMAAELCRAGLQALDGLAW